MNIDATLSYNTNFYFLVNTMQTAEGDLIPPREVKVTISGQAIDPADVSESLRQLEAIRELPENWDSYGSVPPSSTSIWEARKLILDALKECDSLPYFVAPLSGGGVQLEWRGIKRELEVEIGARGEFGYLVIEGKGTPNRRSKEEDNVSRTRILELVRSVNS
jgi:hypothetical protein